MSPMDKLRATHDLTAIKAAFTDGATLNRTKVAARGAALLGMDSAAVIAVIQGLRYPADFEKSATAHHDSRHTTIHDNGMTVTSRSSVVAPFISSSPPMIRAGSC